MASVKGTVLITSIENIVESDGEAGFRRALESADEQVRNAIKGAFASKWYDLNLYCRWLKAVVDVGCNGDETKLIERGARGLSKQLKGVYKIFALFASPESIVQRLALLNQTYFQGITATVKTLSRGKHIICYEGFEPSHRLFEFVLIGWWTQILSTTRAKNPKVELVSSAATGNKCEVALSWDE